MALTTSSCPKCGKLGQPKRNDESTVYLHSGQIKLDHWGGAESFKADRRCTVRL